MICVLKFTNTSWVFLYRLLVYRFTSEMMTLESYRIIDFKLSYSFLKAICRRTQSEFTIKPSREPIILIIYISIIPVYLGICYKIPALVSTEWEPWSLHRLLTFWFGSLFSFCMSQFAHSRATLSFLSIKETCLFPFTALSRLAWQLTQALSYEQQCLHHCQATLFIVPC